MAPPLPRSAQRRRDRFAATQARASLLTVPAAIGLDAVGLQPVGDVLGCTVTTFSTAGYGGCGYTGTQVARVRLSGSQWGGYRSYVGSMRGAFSTALARLRAEAGALGADGVVGIDLSMEDGGEGLYDVVAMGTAVRARSARRPREPFTTDLSGADVAALMLSGWVPVGLAVAVELGMRHNDPVTAQQGLLPSGRRVNAEITGWSELRQAVTAGARSKLRSRAAGADGALLSRLDTTTWTGHCISGSDHIVQTIAIGTTIARFARRGTVPPAPLTVLPLRSRGAR